MLVFIQVCKHTHVKYVYCIHISVDKGCVDRVKPKFDLTSVVSGQAKTEGETKE